MMPTLRFDVPDMTCDHCVAALTRALQDASPGAEVHVELADHRVTVRGGTATAQGLRAAIEEAGYTAVPLDP